MAERPKIHIILGTKAQLIKMAPIMKVLQDQGVPYSYISTGQHKETVDELRENFKIKDPDTELYTGKDITGIMQMGIWLVRILFRCISSRKKLFGSYKKTDIVVVHGDTFSTIAGALIGRVLGMRVAHVESGLRSFNYFHPFPEELTRLGTFILSNIYYCPGEWAKKNIDGFSGKKIDTEMNTLYDALRLATKIGANCPSSEIPNERYAVCTIHRFENIFNQKRFEFIIEELRQMSEEIKILFILHPPTRKQLDKLNLKTRLESAADIELRPRYDYFTFINLINQAEFIVSDGGSNQEETSYLGKPCLLLRERTERNEGLDTNVCVSAFDPSIIRSFASTYTKFQSPPFVEEISPSKTIADSLTELSLSVDSTGSTVQDAA